MSNSGHYGEVPPTLTAQVLDGLPAAVVIMRLDDLNDPTSLRYLYANGPTRDVSGVDPEQVVGRRFVDMGLSEAVLERARLYASVVRSGQPLAMPEFYRESDALSRSGWYSVSLVPLADQCIAFFALNVTERRQAENKVAEQEHFLAAILENLPNMVFVKDAKELKFVRINRAGEQLVGYTREQLLGKNDFDFFPQAQAEFFTEKDRAVLTSGELFDIAEEPIQTSHGERWLHTKKVPVVGDAGIPMYLLGISEDITDQRAQNSELQRLKQLAEASSAAKSSFLARMSHEIRTPLSAILGTTELMLESSLTSEQREQLEGAHSAASGLRALLNDILDFEKSAAGKIELRPQYFPPVFHLEDVARTFRPTAAAKGLQLTASSSAAVPASVQADPLRLRQILVNLVGNALKFTDNGRIDLHVDAQADVDSTEVTLLYTVSDTGIGIHESQQRLVFDAFRQADETTTRAHTGTGLGLAIAKQLVELMGGQLWLRSVEEQGSTFGFSIKAKAGPETVTEHEPPARLAPKLPQDLRVLLVEDNEVNLLVMKRVLERLGCVVLVARTGTEALAMTSDQNFDVALMDMQMPELDGHQATRQIRINEAASGRSRLPIVALTAQSQPTDRESCLGDGADGYLPKPVERRQLVAEICKVLMPKS